MPPRILYTALILSGFTWGCIQREPKGVPLYVPSQPERARDTVAILSGPVTTVDGKNVAELGTVFELLPGCHVVTIGGRVGHMDFRTSGWAATLPPLVYAFRMRAGHTYTIEAAPIETLGVSLSGSLRITALDHGASGEPSEVPFAQTRDEIDECQSWSP